MNLNHLISLSKAKSIRFFNCLPNERLDISKFRPPFTLNSVNKWSSLFRVGQLMNSKEFFSKCKL